MEKQSVFAPRVRPNPLKGLPLLGKLYLFIFVVDDLGADLRLMEEQAALKSMNEEQTASLKTALLH